MKNVLVSQTLSLSIIFALVLQIGAPQAHAEGGGGTGGGGTHTCLNADGSVKSSELYDLYEGREARGYNLVDPTGKTANELLNEAMRKIYAAYPALALTITEKLDYYVKHRKVKENKQFTIIKDANLIFLDQDCQYQQIAQWKDSYDAVFIDGNLNKFFSQSALNVAALALHEAIYAYERRYEPAENSDHSRKLVAQAFSDEVLEIKEPGSYHPLTANANAQYSARITTSDSHSYTVSVEGQGLDEKFSISRGNSHSLTIPIHKLGMSYLTFTVNPATSYFLSLSTIRIEILENGLPIYSSELSPPDKISTWIHIRLAFPYEANLEKQILALPLQ